MFPPVPFGLARIVPAAGITIGGRNFKPGVSCSDIRARTLRMLIREQTKLSVNPRVIHYSRELFGEDAHVYNPYRWMGPSAKDIEKYFVAVSKMVMRLALTFVTDCLCSLAQATTRVRVAISHSLRSTRPPLHCSATSISSKWIRRKSGSMRLLSQPYLTIGLAM